VESDKRVVHGKEPPASLFRVIAKTLACHHPGCSTASQCPGDKTVSIVTRTVYGDEQFAGLESPRVNRDAGHPGQGVEGRGRRDTQRFSYLNNSPPHGVSNGLGFTLKRKLS
jgi:hypothetical protein